METGTITLADGTELPRIGLGTFPLDGDDASRCVASGIEAGYRLIDTAASYGNEAAVGRGIRDAGARREDILITTKLRGRDMLDRRVRGALQDSLAALGVDYVDLYLIHWPLPRRGRLVETFARMADIAGEGLIRSIGVSNCTPDHVATIRAETGLTPVVDQLECDPTIQRRSTRAGLEAQGVVVQSWSPLGRGGPLLSHPTVLDAARATDCTPAQLVLRWHLARGMVPIAKSADPVRQGRNIAATRMPPLPPGVLATLDGLDPDDRGELRIRDPDLYEEL